MPAILTYRHFRIPVSTIYNVIQWFLWPKDTPQFSTWHILSRFSRFTVAYQLLSNFHNYRNRRANFAGLFQISEIVCQKLFVFWLLTFAKFKITKVLESESGECRCFCKVLVKLNPDLHINSSWILWKIMHAKFEISMAPESLCWQNSKISKQGWFPKDSICKTLST